jgi:phosphoribosylformylglycinamidine synthase
MLGLLEDRARRCDSAFQEDGDIILGLGAAHPRLDGSEYLSLVHGRVAGRPTIDLEREVALQGLVRALIGEGLLRSAHDCAEGGVAVALAESAFGGDIGIHCDEGWLAGDDRADIALFGEAQSRIVVSVPPHAAETVAARAAAATVPCVPLGEVGGDRLVIGPLDVDLAMARVAWTDGLARALAGEG